MILLRRGDNEDLNDFKEKAELVGKWYRERNHGNTRKPYTEWVYDPYSRIEAAKIFY